MSLSQREITKAFGSTNLSPYQMDIVHGFIWDSLEFDKGATIINRNSDLFRRPYGGPDNRSWSDTNMVMAGLLPAPEQFAVQRILFTFSKLCDDRDVYTILENFLFRFWLGQKYFVSITIISLPTVIVPVAPIRICEYCRSVYANQERCPHCGATHFTLSSVGDAGGTQYVLDLGVPLQILNQMSFYATFRR